MPQIEFQPDQKFLCQNCARTYLCGDASKDVGAKVGTGYPRMFCGALCQIKYVAMHRRLPSIEAEIPLGEPQVCNLEAPKQRTACVECPFRRGTECDGGSAPEVYVGQAMGPFLLSCHMTPGYWDDKRDPSHLQCAGAAAFRANISRDVLMPKGMLRLPKDTKRVFATPAELVAYHRTISLEEAEAILKETTPEELMVMEFAKTGVEFIPSGNVTDGRK